MAKETIHFPFEFRERGVQRFAPWIDDYGPLGIQPIEVKADGFTHASLDTVADDGFADRARHRKTDVRSIGLRLADTERREQRGGEPASLVINSSKVLGSQQANTFRKTRDGILPTSRN